MEKTTLSIEKIISHIELGIIVLPQFQRGYVWSKEKALKYLESLYYQYPTGSLLIWETPDPPKTRGNEPSDAMKMARVLLDGQQRLTTIFAIAKGYRPPFHDGNPIPEMIFMDLEAELDSKRFIYYSGAKPPRNLIHVTNFFKRGLEGFLSYTEKLSDEDRNYYSKHILTLNKLSSVLKNYEYYEHVIGPDWDLDKVVDIFNRVNAEGVRLGPPDFVLAYICAAWPDAREKIRNYLVELQTNTKFLFEMEYIIRLIAILILENANLSKMNPDRDSMGKRFTEEKIIDAWDKIKKAINYSVNILRSECLFDNSDQFSRYPFLVLWFYLCRNNGYFPKEELKKKMLYWFLNSHIWARYTGPSETILDRDVKLVIDDPTLNKLLDEQRASGHSKPLEPESIKYRGKVQGLYPIFYATLKKVGAIDWLTGQKIFNGNIGSSNQIHIHHIFPKDYLKKNGYVILEGEGKALANELANFALITQEANLKVGAKAPKEYFEVIEKNYSGAIGSQLVPLNKQLWDVKHFKDFLDNRRLLLANQMNSYIHELTGY